MNTPTKLGKLASAISHFREQYEKLTKVIEATARIICLGLPIPETFERDVAGLDRVSKAITAEPTMGLDKRIEFAANYATWLSTHVRDTQIRILGSMSVLTTLAAEVAELPPVRAKVANRMLSQYTALVSSHKATADQLRTSYLGLIDEIESVRLEIDTETVADRVHAIMAPAPIKNNGKNRRYVDGKRDDDESKPKAKAKGKTSSGKREKSNR